MKTKKMKLKAISKLKIKHMADAFIQNELQYIQDIYV